MDLQTHFNPTVGMVQWARLLRHDKIQPEAKPGSFVTPLHQEILRRENSIIKYKLMISNPQIIKKNTKTIKVFVCDSGRKKISQGTCLDVACVRCVHPPNYTNYTDVICVMQDGVVCWCGILPVTGETGTLWPLKLPYPLERTIAWVRPWLVYEMNLCEKIILLKKEKKCCQ